MLPLADNQVSATVKRVQSAWLKIEFIANSLVLVGGVGGGCLYNKLMGLAIYTHYTSSGEAALLWYILVIVWHNACMHTCHIIKPGP